MKTEDLFKYGVMPKEGPAVGQKFDVVSVTKDGVECMHENGKDKAFFKHGEYELYHEPKSLFESHDVKPTWGNLKKAMEAAGLGDDTLFATEGDWFLRGYAEPASFSIEMLREPYEKPKKVVVVR